MKDKIIIDDVNVEECSYYNKDNAPYCCEVWDNECEAQNCYYKQLKRLQEENKRLQMLSCANCGEQYLSPDGAELYEKNVQLQAENEELKHKNEILLGQLVINDGEDVTVQISQSQFNEYNELKAENEQLKKQIEKQKNAKVQLKNLDSRFADDYCKVKAENERLKKEIPKLSDPRYQIMKVNEGYYNRMKAYKQALEEIREIVSDTCRKRCTNECLGIKKHCGYGKILNKINEVLK